MYIIHIPTQPDLEPRLRSTLESAEQERTALDRLVGKQLAVIEQIQTIRYTERERNE